MSYGRIDPLIENWIRDYELRSRIKPTAFSAEERKPEVKFQRITKAVNDFSYFDEVYFPPESYKQGYCSPVQFHKDIISIMQNPGVDVIAGPRKHGKTATGRKALMWMLLNGNYNFAITFSEDIEPARSWIAFLLTFLSRGRIQEDFEPEFISKTKDELIFRTNRDKNDRIVKPFSLGRSVRGQLESFQRPELAAADDIETLDSSFTAEAVRSRAERITEAFASLDNRKGSMTIFANNFDERSLTNRWLHEQEDGVLNPNYRVHIYKAWDGFKPLWAEMYPAETETELKEMLKVRDESDYQGNFQQNPVPPEGFFFQRDYYQEWSVLPKDLKGVFYTDQNLAKKSKGDTTAMGGYFYSQIQDAYFIPDVRCESYSSSGKLFNDLADLVVKAISGKMIVKGVALDGNVSQESYWTELINLNANTNVRIGYLRAITEFKRYNINDFAYLFQMVYNQKKVYFPPGFAKSKAGKIFLTQFFAFTGKKANKKDDAPDFLIAAHYYLLEKNLVRKKRDLINISINDSWGV